jgi:enoyl-CoA hydratase
MVEQERYRHLRFERPHPGVLEIVISRPERLNALDLEGHREITYVWEDVAHDDTVRAVLVTGEGRAFSAGGDFTMVEAIIDDPEVGRRAVREAGDLVRNLIECPQPIVSAINGPAVGAGLAVALLADVSIAARSARIVDGHTTLGVAAGDHSVVVWPLLCGVARAKLHLLTNRPLDGEEAERIGLVSMVVDDDQLMATAREIAFQLADGDPSALQWTKRTINHWLRMAFPAFDASLAYEFLGFRSPQAREGLAAAKEKRRPRFDG